MTSVLNPKKLLASSLSSILSEYCIDIDPTSIELNLLREDKKIELRNVALRPNIVQLPGTGTGPEPSTVAIKITGRVQLIAFDWDWCWTDESAEGSSNNGQGWIRNAALTLNGVRCQGRITESHNDNNHNKNLSTKKNDYNEEEERDLAEEKSRGYFSSYVQNEIDNILDALALRIQDFQLEIELPRSDDGQGKVHMSSLVAGGDVIEVLSLGSHDGDDASEKDNDVAADSIIQSEDDNDGQWSLLGPVKAYIWGKQEPQTAVALPLEKKKMNLTHCGRLNVVGIHAFVRVLEDPPSSPIKTSMEDASQWKIRTFPILDSFDYAIEATLKGSRWKGGDFRTGVTMKGIPLLDKHNNSSNLLVNVGNVQYNALLYFLSFFISQENDEEDIRQNCDTDNAQEKEDKDPGSDNNNNRDMNPYGNSVNQEQRDDDGDDVLSTCTLALPTVTVELFNWMKLSVESVSIIYRLDGKELSITSKELNFVGMGSESCSSFETPDYLVSGRDFQFIMASNVVTVDFECIDEINVAGSFRLAQPLTKQTIVLEGDALSIEILSLEVEIPLDENTNPQKSNVAPDNTLPIHIPFPGEIFLCHIQVGHFHLINPNTGNVVTCSGSDIYMDPNKETQETQIGISMDSLSSKLIKMEKPIAYASLPFGHSNTVKRLLFDAMSLDVTAGFSTEDWARDVFYTSKGAVKKLGVKHRIRCRKKKRDTERPTKESTKIIHCPDATFAQLDIRVTSKGSHNVVNVKETKVVTDPFIGTRNTKLKDIVVFYTSSILKKVPNFVSNAEVLGIEVKTALPLAGLAVPVFGPLIAAAHDGMKASAQIKKRVRMGGSLQEFIRTKRKDGGQDSKELRNSALFYDFNKSIRSNAEKSASRDGFLCLGIFVGCCVCGPCLGGIIGGFTAIGIRAFANKKTQNKVCDVTKTRHFFSNFFKFSEKNRILSEDGTSTTN